MRSLEHYCTETARTLATELVTEYSNSGLHRTLFAMTGTTPVEYLGLNRVDRLKAIAFNSAQILADKPRWQAVMDSTELELRYDTPIDHLARSLGMKELFFSQAVEADDGYRADRYHSQQTVLIPGGANNQAKIRSELARNTFAHTDQLVIGHFASNRPIPRMIGNRPNPEFVIANKIVRTSELFSGDLSEHLVTYRTLANDQHLELLQEKTAIVDGKEQINQATFLDEITSRAYLIKFMNPDNDPSYRSRHFGYRKQVNYFFDTQHKNPTERITGNYTVVSNAQYNPGFFVATLSALLDGYLSNPKKERNLDDFRKESLTIEAVGDQKNRSAQTYYLEFGTLASRLVELSRQYRTITDKRLI